MSVAVALADKLDQLAGFFAIDEKPSGSGDPYALRRAALGVMRLIRENRLRLALLPLIATAGCAYADAGLAQAPGTEVLGFIIERLRVQLRTEGARHDVLAAVFAAGADDDLVRLLDRARAVAALLGTGDGANLLVAYRRAANILRIEAQKDGGIVGPVDPALLHMDEERTLWQDCGAVAEIIRHETAAERFAAAMSAMARLRAPLDAFFDRVTVNAAEPELRRNRLRLLAAVRDMMNQIADFSQIEG